MAVVAVTGASGYIGRAVVASLEAAGHECIRLGRGPAGGGAQARTFALGEPLSPDLLDGCDVLIHCAHDLKESRPGVAYQRNVAGSLQLLGRATTAGVGRIVYISSMSAYSGTRQVYGQTKLECERAVEDVGGVSLRLGLVYASDAGGMIGALKKTMALPVVPLIGRGSYQYVVAHDDAIRAICLAVTDSTLVGTIGVAHPDRVPVETLMAQLAAEAGSSVRFVGVPWQSLYWPMRAVESLGVSLPFRSDSVLGLVRPAPDVPRVDEWATRGLELASFGELVTNAR